MAYLTSGEIKIVLETIEDTSKKKQTNGQKPKKDLMRLAHPSALKIEQKLNDHTRLYVKIKISFEHSNVSNGAQDERMKYLNLMDSEVSIVVFASDENHLLFCGIVLTAEVTKEKDEYYLKINAASHTYRMDIRERTRSFQNKKMTFKALLDFIYKGYGDPKDQKMGYKIVPVDSGKKTLNVFLLQFQETNWFFVKRLASNIGMVIIVDPTAKYARFWVGIEIAENKTLSALASQIKHHVSSNLEEYRPARKEISYKHLKSEHNFRIGDMVKLDGEEWIIFRATAELEGELLTFHYLLTVETAFKRGKQLNNKIGGISLKGKVLAIQDDQLKVHLSIDGERNEEKDCFFPYATAYSAEGNTGLYCMPELNDDVQLYFPSCNEQEGVITASIRDKATENCQKPENKYWRVKTANPKELKFSPDEIMITGQNQKDCKVLIWLNEKKGIVVFGQNAVRFISRLNTSITSKKNIIVSAGSELNVECKDGLVKLKNNEVSVEGDKVLKA